MSSLQLAVSWSIRLAQEAVRRGDRVCAPSSRIRRSRPCSAPRRCPPGTIVARPCARHKPGNWHPRHAGLPGAARHRAWPCRQSRRIKLACLVLVIGRRSDRQHRADRLDSVILPMRVNERHQHLPRRSSSAWAKYADALRRISLARSGVCEWGCVMQAIAQTSRRRRRVTILLMPALAARRRVRRTSAAVSGSAALARPNPRLPRYASAWVVRGTRHPQSARSPAERSRCP